MQRYNEKQIKEKEFQSNGKEKLLKNKIVDTLPVLYLETVILMVLGQFLGNFVLGIPVGIAYARNPEILNSAF